MHTFFWVTKIFTRCCTFSIHLYHATRQAIHRGKLEWNQTKPQGPIHRLVWTKSISLKIHAREGSPKFVLMHSRLQCSETYRVPNLKKGTLYDWLNSLTKDSRRKEQDEHNHPAAKNRNCVRKSFPRPRRARNTEPWPKPLKSLLKVWESLLIAATSKKTTRGQRGGLFKWS